MKNILIIDTNAGNLFSLKSAVLRLGFRVTILPQPNDEFFDGIVIPGQGRFGSVLESLRHNHWSEYLKTAYENRIPILGICVGMQIFFESSEEDSEIKGLGWFDGKIESLKFPKKPMVGWALLTSKLKNWNKVAFYFVNSFALKSSNLSIAETIYGEKFCAAIKSESFIGVQFHPEKSGKAGLNLIKNALICSEKLMESSPNEK